MLGTDYLNTGALTSACMEFPNASSLIRGSPDATEQQSLCCTHSSPNLERARMGRNWGESPVGKNPRWQANLGIYTLSGDLPRVQVTNSQNGRYRGRASSKQVEPKGRNHSTSQDLREACVPQPTRLEEEVTTKDRWESHTSIS